MNPVREFDRRATAVDDWVGTRPLRILAVGGLTGLSIIVVAVLVVAAVSMAVEPLFVGD